MCICHFKNNNSSQQSLNTYQMPSPTLKSWHVIIDYHHYQGHPRRVWNPGPPSTVGLVQDKSYFKGGLTVNSFTGTPWECLKKFWRWLKLFQKRKFQHPDLLPTPCQAQPRVAALANLTKRQAWLLLLHLQRIYYGMVTLNMHYLFILITTLWINVIKSPFFKEEKTET